MHKLIILISSIILLVACQAQNASPIDAETQDIETTPPIYFGMPNEISWQDTSAGWQEEGQKILLTGTVFMPDGKTPAQVILLYYYHTDTDGRYVHRSSVKRSLPPNKMGMTHGYLRGWVKTNEDGQYSIYTIKPQTYPSRDEPAHIHITIKEPGKQDHYYIDDILFDDDPLLSLERRKKLENRGGNGVISLIEKDDFYIGERNIILGLNVPDY